MTPTFYVNSDTILRVYDEMLAADKPVCAAVLWKELSSRELSSVDEDTFQKINDKYDIQISHSEDEEVFSIKNPVNEPDALDTIVWRTASRADSKNEPETHVYNGSGRLFDTEYKSYSDEANSLVVEKALDFSRKRISKSVLDLIQVSSSVLLDSYEQALEDKNPLDAYFVWKTLDERDKTYWLDYGAAARLEDLNSKHGVRAESWEETADVGGAEPVVVARGMYFEGPSSEENASLSRLSWVVAGPDFDGPELESVVKAGGHLCDTSGNEIFENFDAEEAYENNLNKSILDTQRAINDKTLSGALASSSFLETDVSEDFEVNRTSFC